MPALPDTHGTRHHTAEMQAVLLQQVERPGVAVGQVHRGIQNARQQRLPVMLRSQREAHGQKALHISDSHSEIASPSRANAQPGHNVSISAAAASSMASVWNGSWWTMRTCRARKFRGGAPRIMSEVSAGGPFGVAVLPVAKQQGAVAGEVKRGGAQRGGQRAVGHENHALSAAL